MATASKTRMKGSNMAYYIAAQAGTGRVLRGRTQVELAQKLGVHRSNVGRAAQGVHSFVAGDWRVYS